MDFILDGAPVYLAEAGRPKPGKSAVMLFHGAGLDHTVWAAQIAFLGASGAAVVAPDLPGHGRSGGAAMASIEAMAEWTLRLIGTLDLTRPILVGHSMGAMGALEVAAALEGQAAGLALLGAASSMRVNRSLLAAARDDPTAAAKLIAGWAYGPASTATGLPEAGRKLLECAAPGVLARDLEACDRYRPPLAAARVRCPSIVLASVQDRMTPLKSAMALADLIAGAGLVELPSVGHMAMMEDPTAVCEALARLVFPPPRQTQEAGL